MSRPRATVRSTTATPRGTRSQSVKVVVTGPFGAGKTTLVRTISEITVLSTERKVTDHTRALKTQTTVAMDFGRLTIDRDLVLYLFGTPGQRRFDFMWEILAEGMLGFIVMVDAQREESLEEAEEILAFFRDVASVPYVVGVNKSDSDPEASVERTRKLLRLAPHVRAVPVNALDRDSVKNLLLELLYAVLDQVESSQPAAV